MKGAKRVKPGAQRRRLSITPEVLAKLREVWDRCPNGRDAKMLWASCCLCFFGFLRSGEVMAPAVAQYDLSSHLCFGDIQVDSQAAPSCIHVRIKASKTDPFIRAALTEAGLVAKDYAGHSFRIGAATTAAHQDSLIKTLGRWESAAYTKYIRTAPDTLQGVASRLTSVTRT